MKTLIIVCMLVILGTAFFFVQKDVVNNNVIDLSERVISGTFTPYPQSNPKLNFMYPANLKMEYFGNILSLNNGDYSLRINHYVNSVKKEVAYLDTLYPSDQVNIEKSTKPNGLVDGNSAHIIEYSSDKTKSKSVFYIIPHGIYLYIIDYSCKQSDTQCTTLFEGIIKSIHFDKKLNSEESGYFDDNKTSERKTQRRNDEIQSRVKTALNMFRTEVYTTNQTTYRDICNNAKSFLRNEFIETVEIGSIAGVTMIDYDKILDGMYCKSEHSEYIVSLPKSVDLGEQEGFCIDATFSNPVAITTTNISAKNSYLCK